MTITFGPKRKSRYFVIAYGVKNIPEAIKPATPGTADPVVKTIPISNKNGNGHNQEMTFANMSVKVDPDPKDKGKTPHLSRNAVCEKIMLHHPGCNYIVITNIIEMKEKDFLEWNG